jgi:hypothetical protein
VTVCKLLCRHSGLDFAPEVLEHENHLVGLGPGFTSRQRPIDQNSLSASSRDLSDAQSHSVLAAAGETAKILGYAAT